MEERQLDLLFPEQLKTKRRYQRSRLKASEQKPVVIHKPKKRGPKPKPKGAPKDPQRVQHMKNIRLVDVSLTESHIINGQSYGPGVVRVSAILARELSYQEQKTREMEEKFRGTRGVIIGGRGKTGSVSTRLVPVETFNDSLNSAVPFDQVSAKELK